MSNYNRKPAKILRNGRTFVRQPNGSYRGNDGSYLETAIVAAVLSGSGSDHGCSIPAGDSGMSAGGGSFDSGGASSSFDSGGSCGGGGGVD
jgi:hypothetical protein